MLKSDLLKILNITWHVDDPSSRTPKFTRSITNDLNMQLTVRENTETCDVELHLKIRDKVWIPIEAGYANISNIVLDKSGNVVYLHTGRITAVNDEILILDNKIRTYFGDWEQHDDTC